jgi:hypothetical protein
VAEGPDCAGPEAVEMLWKVWLVRPSLGRDFGLNRT